MRNRQRDEFPTTHPILERAQAGYVHATTPAECRRVTTRALHELLAIVDTAILLEQERSTIRPGGDTPTTED